MKELLAILTIVGGHFVPGRRLIGLGFLLLLVLAPFLAVLSSVPLSVEASGSMLVEAVISVTYLLLVSVIWFSSTWIAVRYLKRNERLSKGTAELRPLEAIGAGALAWGAVCVGVIVLIVGPSLFLDDGRRLPLVPSGRVEVDKLSREIQYRQLPAPNGSLVLLCSFEVKGKLLTGERIRLIFADGYASEFLVTDDQGRFSLRLPAGEWRLIAPELASPGSSMVRYEILDVLEKGDRTFVVPVGPPTTKIRIRFWFD